MFGDILVKATIARFARTLATMFAAGVPLVEAMDSVAGAAGNIVYQCHLQDVTIATGTQLQVVMREANLFPHGRANGGYRGRIRLHRPYARQGGDYQEEVDNAVDAMSFDGTAHHGGLGVLIGGLVVAMYLPIQNGSGGLEASVKRSEGALSCNTAAFQGAVNSKPPIDISSIASTKLALKLQVRCNLASMHLAFPSSGCHAHLRHVGG